jgi:hypothetical protein
MFCSTGSPTVGWVCCWSYLCTITDVRVDNIIRGHVIQTKFGMQLQNSNGEDQSRGVKSRGSKPGGQNPGIKIRIGSVWDRFEPNLAWSFRGLDRLDYILRLIISIVCVWGGGVFLPEQCRLTQLVCIHTRTHTHDPARTHAHTYIHTIPHSVE